MKNSEASSMLSDEAIIARVLSGEKEMYELIMRRYNQRLFRLCRAYVRDEDEAEDIVQETHIKAYRELAKFQGRSQLATWLTRILINETLRRLHRGKRFLPLHAAGIDENSGGWSGNGAGRMAHDIEPEESDTPISALMRNELGSIMDQAIDRLPEKYRVVFLMRAIEGMSTAETSACLNISEVNVKVRLNRARDMLKKRIGSEYGDPHVYHFNLIRCDRMVENVLSRVERY